MSFEEKIQQSLTAFSLNVAYYRRRQKLNQEQLAEKAHLSTNVLAKIEA